MATTTATAVMHAARNDMSCWSSGHHGFNEVCDSGRVAAVKNANGLAARWKRILASLVPIPVVTSFGVQSLGFEGLRLEGFVVSIKALGELRDHAGDMFCFLEG